MEVTTHRKTDAGYELQITVPADSDAERNALGALGDQFAGAPSEIADGEVVSFVGQLPLDPETGKPLMSEKDYAEMQIREAGLLIQAALDNASAGKGKKLATEGTTIEPG